MKRTAFAFALLVTTGCQGTPLAGMNGWNQPARVPPPATGSFQVPGTYSGSTGSGAPTASKSLGVQAPVGGGPTTLTQPYLDSLNTAQNQLKQATDNARAAVMQTTNQIQGQVDQASAQIDRFGSGVVQASQVLSESLQPPVPPVMTASATLPNFPPSPPSGSIGDSGATPTVIDPNAQWRKPTPR